MTRSAVGYLGGPLRGIRDTPIPAPVCIEITVIGRPQPRYGQRAETGLSESEEPQLSTAWAGLRAPCSCGLAEDHCFCPVDRGAVLSGRDAAA